MCGLTTRTIEIRFKEHLKLLKSNENQLIHKAIKKYGKEKFYVELLEDCDQSIMSEREQYYISLYDTITNGYNLSEGGVGYYREISIDEKIIQLLCKDYLEGSSLRLLALEYKFSAEKISNILKANNIEIRSRSFKIVKPQILNTEEVQNYLAQGKSYADIARIFNVARSSVRKFVLTKNLKTIIQ